MSFHMEAFRSALASGSTDVFQQITYISAGALLAPSGNGVQVSAQLPFLHSLFGVSAHLENLQVQAASFLPLPYLTAGPNNKGTAMESPPRFWDFALRPKALRPTEFLNMFGSQTSGGSETVTTFVQFTDNNRVTPPPIATAPALNGNGMFTTAHATAATTLTANAWSSVTPVFDQPLPAGQYALVGMRAVSATALAFRISPVVEPLWRPGGVACQSADQLDAPNQRYFNSSTGKISDWGVWVTFFQNTAPNVQFWATSADTSEDMWFDLIKISDVTTSGAL